MFYELICFCYNEACFEHAIGWKFWYECCLLFLIGLDPKRGGKFRLNQACLMPHDQGTRACLVAV